MRRLMTISVVGTEMVAPIVLGFIVDYFTGWTPICLILGAILGLVIGIRQLIVLNKPRPS
jgi:F0F1-type ATP synthase assembly protein I